MTRDSHETIRAEKIKKLILESGDSVVTIMRSVNSSMRRYETLCYHTGSISLVSKVAIRLGVHPAFLIDDTETDKSKFAINKFTRISLNRAPVKEICNGMPVGYLMDALRESMNHHCDSRMKSRGIHEDDVLFFDGTVPTGFAIALAHYNDYAKCHGIYQKFKITDMFNSREVILDS